MLAVGEVVVACRPDRWHATATAGGAYILSTAPTRTAQLFAQRTPKRAFEKDDGCRAFESNFIAVEALSRPYW